MDVTNQRSLRLIFLLLSLGCNEFASCKRHLVATEGETTSLVCPNSTDIQGIYWSGPNATTYNFPSSTKIIQSVPNAKRLKINRRNAALIIKETKLADQGTYMCVGTFGGAEIELIVTNVPPTIIFVANIEYDGTQKLIRGTENQNITLNCSARCAKPKVNLTWSRIGSNDPLLVQLYVSQCSDGTFFSSGIVTLNATRSLDRAVFRCEFSHPTMSNSDYIDVKMYLNLKPRLKALPGILIGTEGVVSTIQCKVTGCRPEAKLTFVLGSEISNDVHLNSVITTSETYKMRATFSSKMTRKDNGKYLTCVVTHPALTTSMNTSMIIDVKYPPVIAVSARNTSVNVRKTALLCVITDGNPENYTFAPWQHTWPGSEGIIRQKVSTTTKEKKATLTLKELSYQDSGFYKCIAKNGVRTPGKPTLWTNQEAFLVVNDVPQILSGPTNISAYINEEAKVVLEVYSNVKPINVLLKQYSDHEPEIQFWVDEDIISVKVPVYNKRVKEGGYRVSVTVKLSSAEQFGTYIVVVENAIGPTHHIVNFELKATVSANSTSSDSGHWNNLPIIFGTTVPAVVCVVIVILFVCYFKRKHIAKTDRERRHSRRHPTVHRRPENDEVSVSSKDSGYKYETIDDYLPAHETPVPNANLLNAIPIRSRARYIIQGNVTVNYYITPSGDMDGYLQQVPSSPTIDTEGPIIEEMTEQTALRFEDDDSVVEV